MAKSAAHTLVSLFAFVAIATAQPNNSKGLLAGKTVDF